MPGARLPDLHVDIRVDDLRGVEIIALLREHLAAMRCVSPPESVHALDVAELRQADITFWTAWDGETLAGCAALKELDCAHGEIKSMRTAEAFLRQGVAARMLGHIIDEARARGLERLSLETGSGAAFEPALALYRAHGFIDCEPFADYKSDPFSRFMTYTL